MKRRTFLRAGASVGSFLILRGGALGGPGAPSNRLNIAMIGVWGRALALYDALKDENIVALCDINEQHLAEAAKKYPNAKTYVDWRKCIEQKDLDAIVCCTADHTHAHIANWAMHRGLHVYMEKPLANSVEEARVVRATYLKNRDRLATQVGTQRHAHENFNRLREMIHDGVIGELRAAWAWGNRQIRRSGYLPPAGDPPPWLHWDLWLGPSPYHPYNPGYFSGGPGANCLQWNMYWDFGSGQVGDMGSHTMDIVWNVVDGTHPVSAEATGEPFNPDVTPVELTATFELPKNDWRPAITVQWCQGGHMPKSPKDWVDLKKIDHGAMFKGTQGVVVADFTSRMVIPVGDGADFTYYRPRSPDQRLPKPKHFQREWIEACKGDKRTSCNFDYAGLMIEMMLLGLVAYRAGKKLQYDGERGVVTNVPDANAYLRRTYRDGWPLQP
ncbi:MAG: Gfo/Idh/MocA family oxidoreductase [Kiritimatiellae bacterium]|nr:Gfo/Idh/MocA family oxidoreductase [Kiritimatiellia bacterium]